LFSLWGPSRILSAHLAQEEILTRLVAHSRKQAEEEARSDPLTTPRISDPDWPRTSPLCGSEKRSKEGSPSLSLTMHQT
jgi:hypothetical protein